MQQRPDSLARYVGSGDELAFRELVDQYQRMVYITCQRILERHPIEVDDAVQETFLKLARNATAIESNLGAWLHSCARTTALNRLRSIRTRGRREHELEANAVAVADAPGGRMEQHEDMQVIEDCVEQLPKRERELVVSYFYLGQTQQQIADRLGVSQVAVQKRLKGVLEVLRHRATRRGLSVAALLAALNLDGSSAMPASVGAHLGSLPVSLVERLAGMPVPAPAPAGIVVSPVLAAGVAAAMILGGGLAFALITGRTHGGGAEASATIITASTAPPAPVLASAPARPAAMATVAHAAPAEPAAALPLPRLPWRADLAPGAWRLKQLGAAVGDPAQAQGRTPLLRLSCPRDALVGTATIATPSLPDAFAVEFSERIDEIRCPFSSVLVEPGLAGHDPLPQPLREVDLNFNAYFPAGAWRRVRCEFRRNIDMLTEDVLVDGTSIRHVVLPKVPAATDFITLRVVDTVADVADVRVLPIGTGPQVQF